MTRKSRAYVAALPLSAIPELKEWLQPFLGGKGQRGNVVMVRLGNEAVARLDQLVEASLFGSRSEAAAFLVGAGIQAQEELFKKIGRQSGEIQRLRRELRTTALKTLRNSTISARKQTRDKTSG
jgi:Arc/MetJ-type ribon-helix-helix transcriptional regulator